MARALWKGAITFGLVNIPVELYPGRGPQVVQVLDARQARLLAGRLQALQQAERQGSRVGRHRQGLRVREGPVRRADRRGFPPRQRRRRRRRSTSRRSSPADEVPPSTSRRPTTSRPPARGRRSTRCCARRCARPGASRSPQVVIRTTQHLAAVVVSGTRADAEHAALPGRAAQHRRARPAGGGTEGRRRHAEGGRARQAAGRRHDRAVEAGRSSAARTTTT